MTREEDRIYRALSRRGFIGATAGATLASLVGREPQQLRAAQAPPKATADAVIVLWMAGGMASTETFDPKRYTPFAPGVAILPFRDRDHRNVGDAKLRQRFARSRQLALTAIDQYEIGPRRVLLSVGRLLRGFGGLLAGEGNDRLVQCVATVRPA